MPAVATSAALPAPPGREHNGVVAAPARTDGATADEVQTYGNFINGEWQAAASGETFENRNPANQDDLVGRFAASGAEDVAAAVAAAAEAAESWRRTSAIARANILHKAAELLAARVNDVGRELTREEGKTLERGDRRDWPRGPDPPVLRGRGAAAERRALPSANPLTLLYTVREPLGVIAAITPWNFPIAIPA